MSIIIIAFPSAPKVDPEAQKHEAELNATLEKKVTELIESHNNDVELSYVHQFLADEDVPHLPPGGGLNSKYACHWGLNLKRPFLIASSALQKSVHRGDL